MRATRSMVMVLCVGVSSAALASARSGDYSVQLLSETGRVLPTFRQDGRSYAMGTLGQRYSLRVRNGSAKRVELVASVDGRDVLDGKTSAWDKRGYLVNPHSEVIIDGFRLSREQVAAFRFSSVHSSYASRMGDARDVGVIGVAVFPELGEAPVVQAQQPFWNSAWGAQGDGAAGGDGEVKAPATGAEGAPQDLGSVSSGPSKPAVSAPVAEREAPPPPSPTAAPTASRVASPVNADLASDRASPGGVMGRAAVSDGPAPKAMRLSAQHAAKKAADRPGLGTEFGEQRYSRVGEREFVRASSKPAAVLSLHYDNHEGLVAMGIDVDRRLELSRLRQGAEPFRRGSPTYERSPALLAR